jgi:adenosylhomocysteine nucleosidase
MLLRWLVANYFRDTAETAVQETLRKAARVVQHAGNDPPRIPEHYRTAILFAQSIESSGLLHKLEEPAAARYGWVLEHWAPLDDRPIRIVETGTGAEKARTAALECIARIRPQWIISAGFAAALHDSLARGDIVMADEVLSANGTSFRVGLHIDPKVAQATPFLHVGRLVSADHVLATPEDRRKLGTESGAIACDMESAAIAEVCQQERIRFLAVRVITDCVDDQLPIEVEQFVRQKSLAGKLGVAAGAVFKRPASIKELWHKRDEATHASQRLASFLRGTIAQLG